MWSQPYQEICLWVLNSFRWEKAGWVASRGPPIHPRPPHKLMIPAVQDDGNSPPSQTTHNAEGCSTELRQVTTTKESYTTMTLWMDLCSNSSSTSLANTLMVKTKLLLSELIRHIPYNTLPFYLALNFSGYNETASVPARLMSWPRNPIVHAKLYKLCIWYSFISPTIMLRSSLYTLSLNKSYLSWGVKKSGQRNVDQFRDVRWGNGGRGRGDGDGDWCCTADWAATCQRNRN